jgi:hypothetical protein
MNSKTIHELQSMDYTEVSDEDLLLIFDVSESSEKEREMLRVSSTTKSIKVGDLKKFLNKSNKGSL